MKLIKKNKLFRYIISHRVFINLGDSVYYVVLMWLLYELTQNSFFTALGGFMFSLSEVLNFFIGPVIDGGNKGKLLKATSIFQFAVVFVLFIFSAFNIMNAWILIFSIPLFNLASRMTYSIHNVIVPNILNKDELVEGNSILSVTSTGIDLVFNAISGILLVLLSMKSIFLFNSGINFIALIVAVILKNALLPATATAISKGDEGRTTKESFKKFFSEYTGNLKEGLKFIKNKLLLSLLIPLIGLNLLYAMMLVNLPEFSKQVFGSAFGYGLVLTFFGIGSILGSFLCKAVSKRTHLGKGLPLLFLFGGAAWIAVSLLVGDVPFVGAFFIIAASAVLGIINILFATLFQQLPPARMIGRINTLNLSLMAVAASVGSLLGGVVVRLCGVVFLFGLCGAGYLLIALFMCLSKGIRGLAKIEDISSDILL